MVGGVIFQGKLNGEFVVYDVSSGEVLWVYDVKLGVVFGFGIFEIDGE